MFAVQYCCWLGMISPPDVQWRISMDVTTWSREPEHHYLSQFPAMTILICKVWLSH